MEKKILTRHPQGKGGRNINLETYNMVKKAISESLHSRELTFTELPAAVKHKLKNFRGSVAWYVETVKLDLESRKTITTITRVDTRSQNINLLENN